MYVGLCKML